MSKIQRILVTGGAGFLGSHLCERLVAEKHDVICVDKDPAKIDALNGGEVPIYEPGLDDLMAKNVRAGRLSFTGDLKDAVASADAVFIAVGTPTRRGDGSASQRPPWST